MQPNLLNSMQELINSSFTDNSFDKALNSIQVSDEDQAIKEQALLILSGTMMVAGRTKEALDTLGKLSPKMQFKGIAHAVGPLMTLADFDEIEQLSSKRMTIAMTYGLQDLRGEIENLKTRVDGIKLSKEEMIKEINEGREWAVIMKTPLSPEEQETIISQLLEDVDTVQDLFKKAHKMRADSSDIKRNGYLFTLLKASFRLA